MGGCHGNLESLTCCLASDITIAVISGDYDSPLNRLCLNTPTWHSNLARAIDESRENACWNVSNAGSARLLTSAALTAHKGVCGAKHTHGACQLGQGN